METIRTRPTISYLVRETVLFLLFTYFNLIGGSLGFIYSFRVSVLSILLIALVILVWLGYRIYHRERPPRTRFDLPILGFLLAQFFTSLLSTDPRRSMEYTWIVVLYAVVFYLTTDLLRHGWPAELFVKSLLIMSIVFVLLGLVEIILWHSRWFAIGGWAQPLPPVAFRVHSFLGYSNFAAGFLVLLIPLALTRLIDTREKLSRTLLALWLAGALVMMFFTSSRGGWLGTAVGLITALLLAAFAHRPRQILEKARKFVASKLWLVLLIIAVLLPFAVGVTWLGVKELSHPSHGPIRSARTLFWSTAWTLFRGSPLWGVGPFTYATHLMPYNPSPPNPPYIHAHSFLITTAAESGLIGLAAVGWMTVALCKVMIQTWRKAGPEHRLLMAGGIASVAGFSAHNLVDNFVEIPAIALILPVVLALVFEDQSRTDDRPRPYKFTVAWLLIPALLFIGVAARSVGAYWVFFRGMEQANDGNWEVAVSYLDKAARCDPHLAFYHLQSGYAHGVLASQESGGENLEQAIAHYEAGIATEPGFSLNYANLAALYWQAGQEDQAVQTMQRAIALTSDEPLYHLNLGYYYERMGWGEEAIDQYQRMLSQRPDLSEASFWRTTALREKAATDWREENELPPSDSPYSYNDFIRLGWLALDRGDPDSALVAFGQAQALDPALAEAYQGLGAAHLALAQYTEANHDLQRALFTYGGQVARMQTLFLQGDLAYLQGDAIEAIARYEQAIDLIRRQTIYGMGTLGTSAYAWHLFRREAIMHDLLPQLVRIYVNDDVAYRYFTLGQWYEETGDDEKALQTYCELLTAAPDFTLAGERLNTLPHICPTSDAWMVYGEAPRP